MCGKGENMKTVVYCGTRNLYRDMIPAMKSLLDHTDVDEIVLCIEDDEFPFELPKVARTVNVAEAGRTIFNPAGPNYNTQWTYMALVRVALAKILTGREKVLSLDVDTIVADDISPMWDINLCGAYFAAVPEHKGIWHPYGPVYVNFGVCMMELGLLRESGAVDRIVKEINTVRMQYNEQDAVNKLCGGKILPLPVRYNDSFCCGYTDNPAIIHYAGFGDWQNNPATGRREWLELYRSKPWSEIRYA